MTFILVCRAFKEEVGDSFLSWHDPLTVDACLEFVNVDTVQPGKVSVKGDVAAT